MNYYKRHIGDYSTGAGHLSLTEHGVYNVLIDKYYTNERAPTKAEAIRWTRATTETELAAVDAVLAEFFTDTEGRFTQKRVEEELATFRAKQEANRILGAKGGKANAKRIATETLSESVANGEAKLKPSHKPVASSQEETKAEARKPGVSPEAVVEAYHDALPACLRVSILSPKRRRLILAAERMAKTVCTTQGWEYGADFWRDFFRECAKDPWYRGDTPNPKNPAWKQSLDVLLRDDHFSKIMDSALAGDA